MQYASCNNIEGHILIDLSPQKVHMWSVYIIFKECAGLRILTIIGFILSVWSMVSLLWFCGINALPKEVD